MFGAFDRIAVEAAQLHGLGGGGRGSGWLRGGGVGLRALRGGRESERENTNCVLQKLHSDILYSFSSI